MVGRSLYVMEMIRFCGDKQPHGAFSCGNAPFGGGEKARLRIQLPQFVDPRWLVGRL